MNTLYAKLGGTLAIVLTIYFGYVYVTNLQEQVVTLTEENTKLEVSNTELKGTIALTNNKLTNTKANLSIVNKRFAAAQEEKHKIIKLFGDHDFAKLIRKKPTLMSKKMTKGTAKIFREIEDETR